MNPSAKGWIRKLTYIIERQDTFPDTYAKLYSQLKESGFIYGHSVRSAIPFHSEYTFTPTELNKTNLYIALYAIHRLYSKTDFEKSCLDFYKDFATLKRNFTIDFIQEKKGSLMLEDILAVRVLSISNPFSKSFTVLGNNILMFTDVLAYKNYLVKGHVNKKQTQQLEEYIYTTAKAFETKKTDSSSYTTLFIKSLEQSLRFSLPDINLKLNALPPQKTYTNYALDVFCMAVWQNAQFSEELNTLLQTKLKAIGYTLVDFKNAYVDLNTFYENYKGNLYIFNSKTAIQNLYSNSGELVFKLVNRNKKRLIKELKESKELLRLIAISGVRSLTKSEQQTVNRQLLDVFKSIPSLAIFLLPGGSLLLPLVIRIIPNILPSSFIDNKIEDPEA